MYILVSQSTTLLHVTMTLCPTNDTRACNDDLVQLESLLWLP